MGRVEAGKTIREVGEVIGASMRIGFEVSGNIELARAGWALIRGDWRTAAARGAVGLVLTEGPYQLPHVVRSLVGAADFVSKVGYLALESRKKN